MRHMVLKRQTTEEEGMIEANEWMIGFADFFLQE